jgi:hypothetical protein
MCLHYIFYQNAQTHGEKIFNMQMNFTPPKRWGSKILFNKDVRHFKQRGAPRSPTTHNPVQQKNCLCDWFPVLIVESVPARCCPLDQGVWRGDYTLGPPGRDVTRVSKRGIWQQTNAIKYYCTMECALFHNARHMGGWRRGCLGRLLHMKHFVG